MTEKILKSKIMIFIILFLVVLLPASINKPYQTTEREVVVNVGIDKIGNGYQMTILALTAVSGQSFDENLQVFSAEGENAADALENLSVHLGKVSGFGNASAIVFSEEVAKEGLANPLDFFYRSKRLNDNPIVIITKTSAKDLLTDISNLKDSFTYGLNALTRLNDEISVGGISTMEQILADYYSGTNITLCSEINETSNENSGIPNTGAVSKGGTQAGASSQGASTSSQEQAQKRIISNEGYVCVLKDAKQIAVLNPDETKGFNELSNTNKGIYTIKNVSDNIYRNANVVVSLKNKKIVNEYIYSRNGIPRVKSHINYSIKVEQILQDGRDEIINNGAENYVTREVIRKFKEQVITSISDAINLSKELDADCFNLQSKFYKYTGNRWKQYLTKIGNKEEAFKNIEYFIDISVTGEQ